MNSEVDDDKNAVALRGQTGNSLATADNDVDPFASASEGAGSASFMKFTGATGVYSYGQAEEEMPYGTVLAADMDNARWAWTFWWEGEVLETITIPLRERPRAWEEEPDVLPDDYVGDMTLEEIRAEQANKDSNFMDGWSCQAVFGLREVGGAGDEYTLKLNQGVSLGAFRNLLAAYAKVYKFKAGKLPIIELSGSSYQPKKKGIGKRHKPILKIVDWMSQEELANAAGDDEGDYDRDDAPAQVEKAVEQKPAAKPEPEPAQSSARPAGRRGVRGGNF